METYLRQACENGTNDGNTVKEVFFECEKVTGKEISIEIRPRRAGAPASLVADNRKAKQKLNRTQKNTLDDSIKSAYAWEKSLRKEIGGRI